MGNLVLLRHGDSVWNSENRFTGWTDVDLSVKGLQEAHQAGQQLINHGFEFDIAYTSVLKRAIRTLWIIQDKMDILWLPVIRSWKLNERHYGALQGLNKAETALEFGDELVLQWRRSYDIRPPTLKIDDPRHPRHDRRYAHLSDSEIPATESLKDTLKRVLPYWSHTITPQIKLGKKVLIVAHGNSLRALIKHLNQISDIDITELNIPTGQPLVYKINSEMNVISSHYLS